MQAAVRSPVFERFAKAVNRLNKATFVLHDAGIKVRAARDVLHAALDELLRLEPGIKDDPLVGHWITNINQTYRVEA